MKNSETNKKEKKNKPLSNDKMVKTTRPRDDPDNEPIRQRWISMLKDLVEKITACINRWGI